MLTCQQEAVIGLPEMKCTSFTPAMVRALCQLHGGLLALRLWWRVRRRKLFHDSHTRTQLILVPSSELEPTAVHSNERGGEGGRMTKPGTCPLVLTLVVQMEPHKQHTVCSVSSFVFFFPLETLPTIIIIITLRRLFLPEARDRLCSRLFINSEVYLK